MSFFDSNEEDDGEIFQFGGDEIEDCFQNWDFGDENATQDPKERPKIRREIAHLEGALETQRKSRDSIKTLSNIPVPKNPLRAVHEPQAVVMPQPKTKSVFFDLGNSNKNPGIAEIRDETPADSSRAPKIVLNMPPPLLPRRSTNAAARRIDKPPLVPTPKDRPKTAIDTLSVAAITEEAVEIIETVETQSSQSKTLEATSVGVGRIPQQVLADGAEVPVALVAPGKEEEGKIEQVEHLHDALELSHPYKAKNPFDHANENPGVEIEPLLRKLEERLRGVKKRVPLMEKKTLRVLAQSARGKGLSWSLEGCIMTDMTLCTLVVLILALHSTHYIHHCR